MLRSPQAGATGRDAGEGVGARGAGEPHPSRSRRFCSWSACSTKMRSMRGPGPDWACTPRTAPRSTCARKLGRSRGRSSDTRRAGRSNICRPSRRAAASSRYYADRRDHALVGIRDVGGVVIEGRERADRAGPSPPSGGVAAEALEEPAHLLMDHRVTRHPIVESAFWAAVGNSPYSRR